MTTKEKKSSAGGCTTPAGNTHEKPMRALVDWVTCSFKSAMDLQTVFNLIGIGDLENLEEIEGSKFAMAKYVRTYRIGMIEFHRSDEKERWLLNMSGQGCRQFEVLSIFDMMTMFGILVNLGTTFTRLDIAIDDFSCIFKTNTVRQSVYNKLCVTRLEDWGNGERGKIAHGKDFLTMDNFYLGSNNSRFFINVYDKKIERENALSLAGAEKKKRIEEELAGVESWTRLEVRFSDEYAEQFVAYMLSDHFNLGYYIMSFLNAKIVFLKPSAFKTGRENRSRLAKDITNHARWWRKYLHNAGKLHLSVYKPDKMLVESKDWLFNQVSTTLAQWAVYKPLEFYEMIDTLVKDGLDKMQAHHKLKIANQQHFDRLATQANQDYDDSIKRYPTWVNDRPTLKQLKDVYTDQAVEQDSYEQKNLSSTSDNRSSDKKY